MRVRDFMEYYYSALISVLSLSYPNATTMSADVTNLFDFLKSNWKTMKEINHYEIQFYQNAGMNELSTLQKYPLFYF